MTAEELLKSVISRIATGPELSKDIELEEAKLAMQAIIRGDINDVRTAIFLIALRMKRETMDENIGILSAILSESDTRIANVDNVIDLGDPYSGYSRSIPISSFLPPLLAELGFCCVIHGLDSIAPKFGLTHRNIYQQLGLDVNISTSRAKELLEDNNIAWAYIDQSKYCQGLYNLVPLRNNVVKRTVINTVETLIAPIRGKKTHAILGYVHKPYPPIYARLAEVSGIDTSLLIRGVEGGVVPSLRQVGLMISYDGNTERQRLDIDPKSIGINQNIRAIAIADNLSITNNKEDIAKHTIELATEALAGKKGAYYDGLLYTSSLILYHLNKFDTLLEASYEVRKTLDSGKALNRIVHAKQS